MALDDVEGSMAGRLEGMLVGVHRDVGKVTVLQGKAWKVWGEIGCCE